jgi:hypothetical protein
MPKTLKQSVEERFGTRNCDIYHQRNPTQLNRSTFCRSNISIVFEQHDVEIYGKHVLLWPKKSISIAQLIVPRRWFSGARFGWRSPGSLEKSLKWQKITFQITMCIVTTFFHDCIVYLIRQWLMSHSCLTDFGCTCRTGEEMKNGNVNTSLWTET